jgi:hypothetical protein
VAFLVIYTVLGAGLAFNVGHVADRWAALNRRMPWALRAWGASDPGFIRAGGLVMVSFGVIVLVWLGFQH